MGVQLIFAKQVGVEVRFIELNDFDETGILLVQKLRFKQIKEVPGVSKKVKKVRQIGIQELIDPMKDRIEQLLIDPAWVVVLFDAVRKEEIRPTLQKMHSN